MEFKKKKLIREIIKEEDFATNIAFSRNCNIIAIGGFYDHKIRILNVNSGQIICKNNRYYVGKPVILFIAKIIIMMKIIILGKKSEFD